LGQQTKVVVNIGDEDSPNPMEFEYPNPYFNLIPVPKASENSDCTSVDTDLMVKVDPTYDQSVNHTYQSALLHSAIQNARKVMGLRPWQNVTVMVDNLLIEGTSGDVVEDLKKSLPSDTTNFMRATFGDRDLEPYVLGETLDVPSSKTFVNSFSWSLVNDGGTDAGTIDGYFGVHYLKPN
jgi:hypothetical protein